MNAIKSSSFSKKIFPYVPIKLEQGTTRCSPTQSDFVYSQVAHICTTPVRLSLSTSRLNQPVAGCCQVLHPIGFMGQKDNPIAHAHWTPTTRAASYLRCYLSSEFGWARIATKPDLAPTCSNRIGT